MNKLAPKWYRGLPPSLKNETILCNRFYFIIPRPCSKSVAGFFCSENRLLRIKFFWGTFGVRFRECNILCILLKELIKNTIYSFCLQIRVLSSPPKTLYFARVTPKYRVLFLFRYLPAIAASLNTSPLKK